MHRSKKKRKVIIFSLIGVLLCMAVGYAAFNTELKISGTSKVTSNWDIEITNVTNGTPVGSAENTVAPTWDALTASMEADLYEKGDAMEYDVTIENKGTIDAKLNDVLTNIENANSEAVNITFSGYTKGEILKSKSVKVIHVKIEYNPNYDGEETSSEVEIKFDYGQNNNETEAPENTHLITYDCTTNGGNDCSNNNEYLVTGSSVDLTKKGTKDNYDFMGWNTDSKATEALSELTVTDTDITLYAIFKAKDTTAPIIDSVNTSTTSNSITVVVAAHDDESGISKYEFSINDGEYINNGNNNVYTFTNLKSDTNYNIKIRVTNGVNLTKEKVAIESIDITDDVVTTGDGLYADEYEDGRYIYKGANPNNYVEFNNELWRIIAKEADGTIKILRNTILTESSFDNANNRSSTYCNNASEGCNAWGSNTTTYNSSGNKVTAISDTYSSSATYALPTKEASLNTYLNTTYYNSLTETARNQIDNHFFNVGTVNNASSNDLKANVNHESKYKWKGNIGLLNVTDYIKASSNPNCKNAYNYQSTSNCYSNSMNHNWITKITNEKNHPRFINGASESRSNVWGIHSNSYFIGRSVSASAAQSVLPVLYIQKSIAIISGDGTQNTPYKLGKGITTSKLEKPTFKESGNSPKTVTITYPDGCGDNLTCTYQKNNGEKVNVTSKTVEVNFTESGVLVANVNEDSKSVSSTYNVQISIDITDNITTTGDGLYIDEYEEGRYIYKGTNPNNYVEFNNELWRIISKETDGTIKIVRNELLTNMAFDTSNSNNWAKPTTLNTYLNGEYYSSLTSQAKYQIDSHDFGIGEVVWNNTSLATQISDEKKTIWNGKIGLINVSDYIKSNTNTNKCSNFSLINTNYSTCKSTTWLVGKNTYWTFSPASNGTSPRNIQTSGQINSASASTISNYRPALYIKDNVEIIDGEGTSSNPYILEDISINVPTFKESGTSPKTVTITYPDGCGSGLTCTYQKNNGEIVKVTSKTIDIEFTENGNLVASVNNGNETYSSSYAVKIGPTIGGQEVNVVTSGAGLYKDEYECRYIYKGANPNNYITFNNEKAGWRIISVECDGKLKIVKINNLENKAWDSNSSTDWGKPTTLNTYLNNTYYNNIDLTSKNKIAKNSFSIGKAIYNNNDLKTQINNENSVTWTGYIALPTLSEYLRTNSNKNQCATYNLYSKNIDTCKTTNWMYNSLKTNWWLLTIRNDGGKPYQIYDDGYILTEADASHIYYGIKPTLYLSSGLIAEGQGTASDPYVLSQ